MMAWLLLAAGDDATKNLSIFAPASPATHSIVRLAILIFAITGLIFVVVEGVLLYCLRRFRRTAGDPAAHLTSEPPQVYGSRPIEIAWTAAPLLIVMVIVLVSARTLWDVDVDPPKPAAGDNALFVTVVGRQWWWEYRYERYDGRALGFITANELHIPVSDDGKPRPVFLSLKSADVYHSFWVPRLAGKTALIPGHTNSMWLASDETGLFVGQCAEYCGTQHANMLIRVNVETPADFQRWLDNQMKPPAGNLIGEPDAVAGKTTFLSQSCVNCHRVEGTAAQGDYAPDLTHLMSRQTLGSGMSANDPQGKNLRDWVAEPQKVKPGCLMPAFGLSKEQLRLIVSYLKTLH
jgi:cytochrome c oxidase subunit II